jgi:probable FeS assembly SUF system protein SufT
MTLGRERASGEKNMEHVELTRDCEAIRIPAGDRITLPRGTEAFLTQSLGGSFTLQVRSHGGLFRISGRDADAIGKDVPDEAEVSVPAGADLEEQITTALKTCYDPEIPVNIVDLGLIYDTRIHAEPDGTSRIAVKMTLTAQGCGMGAAIAADAEDKIRSLPGVRDAVVEIVWDPPWNPRMISEEGRKKLGL